MEMWSFHELRLSIFVAQSHHPWRWLCGWPFSQIHGFTKSIKMCCPGVNCLFAVSHKEGVILLLGTLLFSLV